MPSINNEIEKKLWTAADQLRANSKLKASEYSVPVLGLIFLRFADKRFGIAEKELAEKAREVGSRRAIGKADYQARGVMYLPEQARYSYLLKLPEGENIGKAVLPDPKAFEFAKQKNLFTCISDKIRALTPPADITGVMADIEKVLDHSIASEGYIIHEDPAGYNTKVDLSQIDFEALRRFFEKSRKHTEVEKLKGMISAKLNKLVCLNRSRIDFAERFQKLIDEYNSGALNVELMFDKLLAFAKELTEEKSEAWRNSLQRKSWPCSISLPSLNPN